MASANMKDIKRRIKSVESTMQITKAMELVASSKLRKAKEKADIARPFFDTLYETMCEIHTGNAGVSSKYTRKQEIKSVLLIVIAGDRGLAGGFNSNVLKLAEQRASELKSEGKQLMVLPIGKKSVEYFEKRGYSVAEGYAGIAETMDIYDASLLTDKVIGCFVSGEVQQAELIYTTFVSALSQQAKRIQVLPFSLPEGKKSDKPTELTTYDPSPEAVLDEIIPRYLSGIIYGAVVDSFASEQAARRTAMESASDNAGEMIDSLSLIYNRARQAAITQEISEIVGGAQAQN